MTTADLLAVAALVAGIAIVVVLAVRFAERSVARLFAPAAERLHLTHPNDDRGRTIPEELRGEHHGHRVRIRYRHGSRSEPASLTFAIEPRAPLPVPGFVRVRRKRIVDRLAVAAGLARRLWDPGFGGRARVFVEAEDDRYAEALVRDLSFREAVLPLMALRRPSLVIEPRRISLTLTAPFLFRRRALEPEDAERILYQLTLVGQLSFPDAGLSVERHPAVPGAAGPRPALLHARGRNTPLARIVFPMTLLAAVLLFAGPLMLWWSSRYPPLTWDLHLLGLGAGGAAVLIYGALLFPTVRGHSQSLSTFSTLLFFALVGLPTSAAGGLVVVNGLADRHEPVQVEGRVIGRQGNVVAVAIPLDDGRLVRVRLQIAVPVEDDERIAVVVRRGALGHPWYSAP